MKKRTKYRIAQSLTVAFWTCAVVTLLVIFGSEYGYGEVLGFVGLLFGVVLAIAGFMLLVDWVGNTLENGPGE